MLTMALSSIDGIKGQFQPARSAHLIEDPKQIVADSVLAQIELMGNIAIGETFGHQVDNALFPFRQHTRSSQTNRFGGRSRAQGFYHETQFLAASPHLPLVYCVNALAQQLRRLIPREYAGGSCAKCFDDHCRFARIKYHDGTELGMRT